MTIASTSNSPTNVTHAHAPQPRQHGHHHGVYHDAHAADDAAAAADPQRRARGPSPRGQARVPGGRRGAPAGPVRLLPAADRQRVGRGGPGPGDAGEGVRAGRRDPCRDRQPGRLARPDRDEHLSRPSTPGSAHPGARSRPRRRATGRRGTGRPRRGPGRPEGAGDRAAAAGARRAGAQGRLRLPAGRHREHGRHHDRSGEVGPAPRARQAVRDRAAEPARPAGAGPGASWRGQPKRSRRTTSTGWSPCSSTTA